MKQSSIEWLVDQMKQRESQGITLSMYELQMFAEQAKEMHKKELVDFSRECLNKAKDTDILTSFMNVEHHYKNTYENETNQN